MVDVITGIASSAYFPGGQTSIKVSVPVVYKLLTRNCLRKIHSLTEITVQAYSRLI